MVFEEKLRHFWKEPMIEEALEFRENIIPLKPQKWCMYLWIPQGIKMKKGKMAGQVAHASARLARMMDYEQWSEYIRQEVKYVYKVKDIDDLIKLEERFIDNPYKTLVFDNTWNMYTCFGIMTKEDLIGEYRLA